MFAFKCVPALAAPEDVWEIKQFTDHFGPTSMLISADAMKFVSNGGNLVIISRAPTWKVIAYNKQENVGLEIPLAEWPSNGLRMFKGKTEMLNEKPSIYFDPLLKVNVLQRILPVHGAFYGNNDPAIFRAAEKKQMQSMHLNVSTNIPINEQQKSVLHGVYSLPYCGGFPLELATVTTDGATSYIYRTSAISRKKLDSSVFTYPSGYKLTKERFEVYVTSNQKKRFEDFLDAFTDDTKNENRKSDAKSTGKLAK
ncbi:MAG: hypothetical protein JST89_07120 [Cyanobacteria bacterium SZAS-4]|nr:hypothetical protein [Cyanobacteria bacterium SZAS-4]